MTKRYVLLLVLTAIALTACSIALSRRDSRDWRANRSRRLFPFPWQDTVSVSIEKPGAGVVRFVKSPEGEWQIRLPHDLSDSLSNLAVDHLTALATLTWREPMAEAAGPAPGQGVVLTAESNAGQRVELAFGAVRNNLRATVIDGDQSTLYGVNQDLLDFLDWRPERFRNLYLASGGGGRKPFRVALSPAGGDPDLRIILERGEEGWRQAAPVVWPVDETRLDLLLRWLERLHADSIEAEMSGDMEWFGFGGDCAFVEVDYRLADGQSRRRVEFGKPAGDGKVYARVVGRSPIFAVSEETLAEISLTVAMEHRDLWRNFYRQRTLNTIGDTLPAAIVIERLLPQPALLTLEQRSSRDGIGWVGTLETGGETRQFAVDPPDANEPMRPLTALITGLSTLKVKRFLAESEPGPDTAKWTALPAWRYSSRYPDGAVSPTVTVYAADSEGGLAPGAAYGEGVAGPLEMTTDSAKGPGIPFSVSGQPAVLETFAEMAYLLCLPPYRYRSRKMLDHDSRNWRRVELSRPDRGARYFRGKDEVNEQWWRDPDHPEPLLDDNNRFVALLNLLSQLRSEGFVQDDGGDIAKFGLDQPVITAIVYTSQSKAAAGGDGILFTLTVGGEAPEGGRYARLDGKGPVFVISRRLAEGLDDKYF